MKLQDVYLANDDLGQINVIKLNRVEEAGLPKFDMIRRVRNDNDLMIMILIVVDGRP